MKKYLLAALCFIAVQTPTKVFSQASTNGGASDSSRSSWEYIPKTLAEAHEQLERLLPKQELTRIDTMQNEDEMIIYHHGLGMGLRNGWGLWGGSRLAQHFNQLGFFHPDDISGVMLATLWCKRHQQNFRMEERAAYYRAYWGAYIEPPEDAKDPRDSLRDRLDSKHRWY